MASEDVMPSSVKLPVRYEYLQHNDGITLATTLVLLAFFSGLIGLRDYFYTGEASESTQYAIFLAVALPFLAAWLWRIGPWFKPELTIEKDRLFVASKRGPFLPKQELAYDVIVALHITGVGMKTNAVFEIQPKDSKFKKSINLRLGRLNGDSAQIVNKLILVLEEFGLQINGPVSSFHLGDKRSSWLIQQKQEID